ncbi:MAG: hypothetical protein J3Q66DRAFT_343162 [Benniella sp.]|nr:MAG: hypothetical protein J3Q66DRAFT_343162 [Benniella sp.]
MAHCLISCRGCESPSTTLILSPLSPAQPYPPPSSQPPSPAGRLPCLSVIVGCCCVVRGARIRPPSMRPRQCAFLPPSHPTAVCPFNASYYFSPPSSHLSSAPRHSVPLLHSGLAHQRPPSLSGAEDIGRSRSYWYNSGATIHVQHRTLLLRMTGSFMSIGN